MAFGIDDGLALAGGIFSGLGGGGQSTAGVHDPLHIGLINAMQQMRAWQRAQGLAEGTAATGFQRQIEQAPMRDRLYYNLMARMGLPQQSLNYDNSGYTPQSQANANPATQYNQALQGYRPGFGGVDMNQTIQRQMLGNLGYGNNGTPNLYNQHINARGSDTSTWLKDYLVQALGGGGQNKPTTLGGAQTSNGPPMPNNTPIPQQSSRPTMGAAPGGTATQRPTLPPRTK